MFQLLLAREWSFRVEVVYIATIGQAGARQAQTAAGPRKVSGQERMQGDGQAGLGGGLPDRVVYRVVEWPPVHGRVGPHEDGNHARQGRHPTDLLGYPGDV